MATLFLLVACSIADTTQPDTPASVSGFDSPEDAVVAYLEGLRDSDLDRMISTFALEPHVERFDLETFLERLRIYQHPMTPLPDANEFAMAINIELRRAAIINQIRGQYMVLTHPERHTYVLRYTAFQDVWIEEGGAYNFIQEFSEILNAPEFHTLEIQGFLLLEWSARYRDTPEIHYRTLSNNLAFLGADQLVSRIVVFSLNGNYYLLFVDLAEYSGKWYINTLGGVASHLQSVPGTMWGIMVVSPDATDAFSDEIEEWFIREW